MNKYIVCFDVETSGLSPQTDYILQLAMIKLDAETLETVDQRNWYINPAHAYEISQGAFEAHGLTKEFINKNGVSLQSIGQEIIDFVEDSDYLTYNGNSFDVKFVYKDLQLVGFEFPIEGKIFYDAFSIYKLYHPSTLSAVYKNLTGKDLEDAHDAFADVKATIAVFGALRKEQSVTNEELSNMQENQMISPEGSIRRATNMGDGDCLVFSVGKYKDAEFCEVLKKDPSYVKWFGENVASEYTKKMLNDYYKRKNSKKA
jgi:DNA polymerase III epsilon subunit-like protein